MIFRKRFTIILFLKSLFENVNFEGKKSADNKNSMPGHMELKVSSDWRSSGIEPLTPEFLVIFLVCFAALGPKPTQENDHKKLFHDQTPRKYGTGPGSNSRPLDLQSDSHLLPDTLPTINYGLKSPQAPML